MKHKLPTTTKQLRALFILVPALILTLAVISQPQAIRQFAQDTFSEPPLYGCLQVGEGNKSSCASRLGITTAFTLTLNGRPLNEQTTIYYGDRVKGSVKFTNVGDLPIKLTNIGLAAETLDKTALRQFVPLKGQTTLTPKQDVTLSNASYRFQMADPNTEWTVGTKILTAGGEIPTTDVKNKLTVNSTCTALRVLELTDKDKANLQKLCSKNPTNKLCSSRQYCEIIQGKGPNCSKPNASTDIPRAQCDEWIVPDKPEQDLLEELCKVSPNTDACKRFCDRAIESAICARRTVWVDKKTGKELVPQPEIVKEPQTNLLGAKTSAALEQQEKEKEKKLLALCIMGIGSCKPPPPPPPRAPGPRSAGAGFVPGQGTSMRPAPPAPRVVAAGTGCDKHPGCRPGTPVGRSTLPPIKKGAGGGPPNLYQQLKRIGGQNCVESGLSQLGSALTNPSGGSPCTPVALPNMPRGCATLTNCYARPEPRSPANANPSPNGHRPCSYGATWSFEFGGVCRSIQADFRGILPRIKITPRNPDGTLNADGEHSVNPIDLIPAGRLWKGIKMGGVALVDGLKPHIGTNENPTAIVPTSAVRPGQIADPPQRAPAQTAPAQTDPIRPAPGRPAPVQVVPPNCNQTMKRYCDGLPAGGLQNDCRRGPGLSGC